MFNILLRTSVVRCEIFKMKAEFIPIHMSVQEKLERACWQDPKNDSKIPTKREKKFRQTSEKMEGFSFVTPVTGLNRHNIGKEDDDYYN
jgi:hypothetical protein